MVKTRSSNLNIVSPLLGKPIKPMNFKFADRKHAVEYMEALEYKIKLLNKYTNNGCDFSSKKKFPIYFTYPLLVDFYHLIDDYLDVKDKYLYFKNRKENEEFSMTPDPELDCFDCSFYKMVKDVNAKYQDSANKSYCRENKKNYGSHLFNK